MKRLLRWLLLTRLRYHYREITDTALLNLRLVASPPPVDAPPEQTRDYLKAVDGIERKLRAHKRAARRLERLTA